jgi:hypothetical protein
MAYLQELQAHQTIYLGTLHILGRNPSRADTVLHNPDASQVHASIRFNGSAWEIIDHSRCGSMIDNKALPPHTPTTLTKGQVLRFGPGAIQRYVVANLDVPCPLLIPHGHQAEAIALQRQHFFPNQNAPATMILQDSHGNWHLEDGNDSRILHDGNTMCIAGKSWRFFNRIMLDSTVELGMIFAPPITNASFNFMVSQNEEHIQLAVTASGKKVNLGERSHHYCLLTLARQRVMDAKRGFDALSQGWIGIDKFSAMMGVEEKHLNMMLYRARQQLAKICEMEALCTDCIERRRGELRFGSFPFQIMRGFQLEAVFDPTST